MSSLLDSLNLPCGAVLKNRLCKAAMTERLSGTDYLPNHKHQVLYDVWAEGGAGLMISGNIIVDRFNLESAGNVVLEDESVVPHVERWTALAKKNGHHFWAQISHAGRQCSKFINPKPVSASAVQLDKMGLFNTPRALRGEEITELVQRFANTAAICKKGGFTGVQIHAAHGYLVSQFLSPLTNQRQDEWGGSIENRARFLLEIIRATRAKVGADFPISVKINSADFQRGGFNEEEAWEVVKMLEKEKIDLLEISGGTYENPKMILGDSQTKKESTRKREAYFLDFAEKLREIYPLPLMVTGGFRSRDFVEETLAQGKVDMIGMGKPFLTHKYFAREFLKGSLEKAIEVHLAPPKNLADSAEAGFYDLQIKRLAQNKSPKLNYSAWYSSLHLIKGEMQKGFNKRWFGKKS